jgi:hypothetical protein
MAEKKKIEPKRKLTLHRETLKTLEQDDVQLLDGVVGGTYVYSKKFSYCDDCESIQICPE